MPERIVVANAFSLTMLPRDARSAIIDVQEITPADAARCLREAGSVESAIGHADFAAVVSAALNVEIPANRVNVVLDEQTELLVASRDGARMAEGASAYDGAPIRFFSVSAVLRPVAVAELRRAV